jgi:hypothetical protein
MSIEEKRERLSPFLRRLLILKVWLIEKFRFGERQVTLVWAGRGSSFYQVLCHRIDPDRI